MGQSGRIVPEDGTLISERGEAPSKDLEEEFSTEKYRFVSELAQRSKVCETERKVL